jgi:hypothetical protein
VEEELTTQEQLKVHLQELKTHLQVKKKIYLTGAGAFVMGAAVGVILKSRPTTIINQVAPNIAPVFNNTVNNGGYMRKIVRCVETDELWPSVSKAAEAAGVAVPLMSRHLNGHHDHINDLHFVIEGLAAG